MLSAVYIRWRSVCSSCTSKENTFLSMLIPPLICWVLGFDSRRENLIENQVGTNFTVYRPVQILYGPWALFADLSFGYRLLYFLFTLQWCEAHIRYKGIKRRSHWGWLMFQHICQDHFTGLLSQGIDSNPYNPKSNSRLRSVRPNSGLTCPDGSRPSDGGKCSLATSIFSENSA